MMRAPVQHGLFEPSSRAEEFLDGLLAYHPGLFEPRAADGLFRELRDSIPWRQPHIRLFGRELSSPRLAAWYGDAGAVYTYSGLRNEPLPWTAALSAVRRRVQAAVGASFNSVLANYYRDGDDAMGWHSDDEAELDPASPIASISLGCARRFSVKHRRRCGTRLDLTLENGSLLVMRPTMQRDWRHALPRARGVGSGRINLTFRRVK